MTVTTNHTNTPADHTPTIGNINTEQHDPHRHPERWLTNGVQATAPVPYFTAAPRLEVGDCSLDDISILVNHLVAADTPAVCTSWKQPYRQTITDSFLYRTVPNGSSRQVTGGTTADSVWLSAVSGGVCVQGPIVGDIQGGPQAGSSHIPHGHNHRSDILQPINPGTLNPAHPRQRSHPSDLRRRNRSLFRRPSGMTSYD
jgi:hypothetical protein